VIGNLVSHMGIGADPKLIAARPITVESITDTHDHFQFQGDGTLAHPTLYNREVLAVLPFQVNARRFVIPFYVMTRDVTLSLPPEQYRLTLAGLHVKGATFSSYDPITGVTTPVRAEPHGAVAVTLAITSTDYPRLLTIQER
jgi:hypothetical protein